MAISLRYLIRTFLLLGLLFGVAVSSARAADPATPAKEVSLKFTVFALGGADGLAYRSTTEGEPRALKFYSAYRSAVYVYKGAEQLSFFEADTIESAAPRPVAVYTIPKGATNLLLLFFPRESPAHDGLKYDVHGVDDSTSRTPPGHFTTINVSGREYAGLYAGQRITIPQGVGEAHMGRSKVSLQLASQVEGSWLSTGRHEFSMSSKDRVTLIFYPSASRTGAYPIIRRLVDTPSSIESEKGSELAQLP
ncbi:MAG: hypothetical protein ABW223_09065 [Rariglobus sp.]